MKKVSKWAEAKAISENDKQIWIDREGELKAKFLEEKHTLELANMRKESEVRIEVMKNESKLRIENLLEEQKMKKELHQLQKLALLQNLKS